VKRQFKVTLSLVGSCVTVSHDWHETGINCNIKINKVLTNSHDTLVTMAMNWSCCASVRRHCKTSNIIHHQI